MAIFSIIPIQVSIEVLSAWCSLKDLNEFDSAACNISFRKTYLHMINYPLFVISDQPEWKACKWLSTRKIKFAVLCCMKENLEAMGRLNLDTSKVQQIQISGPDKFGGEYDPNSRSINELVLLELINSCPSLARLDISYVEFLVDDVICQIKSVILLQLTHLSIENQSYQFTELSLKYLSRCCRNLVLFQFQAGGWGPDLSIKNEYFIALIKSNPQLKHIKIRQESHSHTSPSDCFLPIIAKYCPEMESVEFGSDFLYSAQNIAILLTSCPKINYLFITSHTSITYGFELLIDKRPETHLKLPNTRKLIVFGRDTTWTEEPYVLDVLKALLNQIEFIRFSYRFNCSTSLFNQIIEHFPNLQTLILEHCQVDVDEEIMTKVVNSCKKLHHLTLKGFHPQLLLCILEGNNIKILNLEEIYGLTTEAFVVIVNLNRQLEKISVFESDVLVKADYEAMTRFRGYNVQIEWKITPPPVVEEVINQIE